MKLVPPDQRQAISALRLALTLVVMALVPVLLYAAPIWWSQHNVLIHDAAPDDYAPANHGQLKNIAKAAVAEILAQFRGEPLAEGLLDIDGTRLAAVPLHLADDAELVDLDDPRVLQRQRLRPSAVATHERAATQAYAKRLFDGHPGAAGVRWWSTIESSWIHVTLFDRALRRIRAGAPERLALDHPAVVGAAEFLGLA